MTAAPVTIDSAFVYRLLGRQFPQWAILPIQQVIAFACLGWALWKALIVAARMMKSNAFEATRPWRIIEELLADHELERH